MALNAYDTHNHRDNHDLHDINYDQQGANQGRHDPVPVTPSPTPTPAAPVFSDLGQTFNDATRALEGGLWQSAVNEGGQGNGSIGRYTTDLTNVENGLTSEVNAGQFKGDTLADVNKVLAEIKTALSAASASVDGGGAFGSVAAAEKALHESHLDILNAVNNDPKLAALATHDGANGFLAAPAAFAQGVTAANAPHADLAEIGAIFNDASNHILGGVNAGNAGVITNDVNAMITDMQSLMKANPHMFEGLTGVHAETIVRQLELELSFVKEAGTNPVAGRASNDNMLDIIDIVQGDPNLVHMASQHGVTGFAPFGDALNPTPKYLDNAAQTNFWANFIAQSNSLGQQAIHAVDAHDAQAISTVTAEMQTFQKDVTAFDSAQGGIFEARFDNELLGNTSTLGAEVSKMLEGLHSGNATLVAAAAQEMHANAADVGGNNVPTTGGTYNADGLTVAQVLTTAAPAVASAAPATPTQATAPVATAPAATAPATQTATNTAAAAPTHAADTGAHLADAAAAALDLQHPQAEMANHLQHMWG